MNVRGVIRGAIAPVVLIVAMLVGLTIFQPVPVAGQQNSICYRAQGGALWGCGSGGTLRMGAGSALDVQAGATFTVASTAVLNTINLSQAGVVTVTNGSTITPTGTYQQLSAAAAVGTASILTGTAGQLLVMVNTANQTITLTDTGSLMLSGNLALGQYDSVALISDGTNWIQLATSNN